MFNGGVSSINAFMELLSIFCGASGAYLLIRGLLKLPSLSKERREVKLGALFYEVLMMPAMLVSIGTAMAVMTATIFGQGMVNRYPTLAYSTGGGDFDRHLSSGIQWFFQAVAVVGWLAFVKGIFHWKAALEGKAGATKSGAFVYGFGGVCCANFSMVIDVVQSTFGFKVFN